MNVPPGRGQGCAGKRDCALLLPDAPPSTLPRVPQGKQGNFRKT
jgi:hypothetical protein